MDCCASKLEPSCFGFAVEVGGEGVVESFELGEIGLDTGVDGMLEVLVGETIETWERSADGVRVLVMIANGVHVAKYPNVVD